MDVFKMRGGTALRIAPILVAAALGLAPAPAVAQPKPAASTPALALPDDAGTLGLIRTVLLALDAANGTGNYTVLRDMGAPAFRDGNTAARLAEIFASQRAGRLDLSGVAVAVPELTLPPQVEPSGMLHVAGAYTALPQPIRFELLFAPTDGRWKLFGLAVNVGANAPTSLPSPPPVAPATPQAEAPRPAAEPVRRAVKAPAPKPKRPPPASPKPAPEAAKPASEAAPAQ